MGKGKNKTFKLKEYKIPKEKYVVVINPWGLPERFDQNTKLNEVGAWFQLLLRKDYPSARVREIFYQKTHRNIIVVLPQEIDITKYLGGYQYSQFHNFISPDDTRTVYIYEYRFATFGNPGKTNWTGIVPTNDNIPPDLLQVLKYPFPFPTPAPLPPSDILYARPIPRDIQNILATVRLIASTSELRGEGKSMEVSPPLPAPPPAPNVGSSCSFNQPSESTGSLFMSLYRPYEPYVEVSKAMIDQQEDRDVAHELPQVKKMDPYEEEEVEKALLRSLSPVKKYESNEAIDEFLNSVLSKSEEKPIMFPPSIHREDSISISRTASTFDGEGDYKPSQDLLDLFNTLPDELSSTARKDVVVKSEILDTVLRNDRDSSSSGDREDVIVKSEVIGTEMMPGEGYHPSDKLLAAFSDLPDAAGYEGQSIKQEPKDSANTRLELRVKEEPTEIQLPERRFSSLSDRKQLPRPSTSRTTKEIPPRQLAPNNNSTRYNSNVQVKPEPVDDTKAFFSSNNRHVPVPHDRQRSMFPPAEDGNSQPSRDPRKRPMPPIKNDLNEDEESVFGKRLKMEH